MEEDKIFSEVKEIIGADKEEFTEEKQPIQDKRQTSLRIPKSFVQKARINKESKFLFIMHPTEKTLEKIKGAKPKLVVYLEDGKKEE